jgi:3-hydroxyisobutyrate dehydrogenase
MAMETIGFIGLGAMGAPMAARLVGAEYGVVGVDPSPSRRVQAEAAGVHLAGSPREAAAAATRTVISVVRDAAQTEEVVNGPDGILAAGREQLDLLLMSTLDPGFTERTAALLAEHGITAVAAPVSGGVAGATDGTLTIIAAGDPATLSRCRPLLDAMGANVFVLGERPAMAQAAKLANQVALAAALVGVRTGTLIASAYGVDEDDLVSLLEVSTGDTWAGRNWDRARRFWEEYVPGNELDIILKDLRSVLREAEEQGWNLPIAGTVEAELSSLKPT